MARGSFEDGIKKQFEGQSVKAPRSVWGGIEGRLNTELIFSFKTSQSWYKWSAVAAIFIAINSLAIHYFPESIIDSEPESVVASKSYNALLSKNDGYSEFQLYTQPRLYTTNTIFYPIRIEKKDDIVVIPYEKSSQNEVLDVMEIEKITTSPTTASVDLEIYPYHKGIYLTSRSTRIDKSSKKKLWAGIEAGAGNFNSSYNGTDAFGNVNAQNLASAVGTDAFVNPTTVVNPQLNTGVATTLGLDFGMKLGKRWSIESGVSYTNVDSRGSASINVLDIYTVDNGDFIGLNDELGTNNLSRGAPLEIQESYDHEVDLQNNIQFTSIPLKAGYFILDNKMSLRVNAGLSANYFMSSRINDPSQGIISNNPNDLFNAWSFDGIGGLEFGYSIFDKFNLTIEPNYRHAITPISNTTVSPSRFIVQTGLRYTIK